jgi:hypothetical protein
VCHRPDYADPGANTTQEEEERVLRNFDDDAPTGTISRESAHVPHSRSNAVSKRHLLKTSDAWGAPELHDYVSNQLLPGTEIGSNDSFIFRGFVSRWKERAVPIAKFAFEVSGGEWHGQPVAPYMFQKGYDPYFASEIARLLETR